MAARSLNKKVYHLDDYVGSRQKPMRHRPIGNRTVMRRPGLLEGRLVNYYCSFDQGVCLLPIAYCLLFSMGIQFF